MTALYLRFLNGDRKRFVLDENMTLPKVLAQLEQTVPPCHDVRLFQGDREVGPGDLLEVEVQAVVSASPAKAAARIVEYVEVFKESADERPIGGEESDWKVTEADSVAWETATATLRDSGELDVELRKTLLDAVGSLWIISKHSHKLIPMLKSLGKALGCSCGDPVQFFDTIHAAYWDKDWPFTLCCAEALLEVARSRKDLDAATGKKFLKWARKVLNAPTEFCDYFLYFEWKSAICVIGQLGDATDLATLERLLIDQFLKEEASAALALVQEREQRQFLPIAGLSTSDSGKRADNDADAQAIPPIAPQPPTDQAAAEGATTDSVQEHQADLMRALINSKQDLQQSRDSVAAESAEASVAVSVARSEMSVVSAADHERCFLPGTMLPDVDGKLVRVEQLKQHDHVRAADGQTAVRIARVQHHTGLHQIVTLQSAETFLRMTASHRVMVQRGGRNQAAPAKTLRAGEHVVCRFGVLSLAAKPVLTEEDIPAIELVFDPNVAIETFAGVPENAVLTMGSRPKKRRRAHTETNDTDMASMPATDDGFEDHF